MQRAATAYGFDEWSTDWHAVVERPDIDIVDVCTPPGHHAEVIAAAAAAGKAIICEKPLAENYESARAAAHAATERGVLHASIFNYQHLPAVALMRRMIADGAIGEPLLWRAIGLGDEFADPAIPFDWRFDLPFGGSTILDLGADAVDLARLLVGEIDEVVAQSATFITSRPDAVEAVARPRSTTPRPCSSNSPAVSVASSSLPRSVTVARPISASRSTAERGH